MRYLRLDLIGGATVKCFDSLIGWVSGTRPARPDACDRIGWINSMRGSAAMRSCTCWNEITASPMASQAPGDLVLADDLAHAQADCVLTGKLARAYPGLDLLQVALGCAEQLFALVGAPPSESQSTLGLGAPM